MYSIYRIILVSKLILSFIVILVLSILFLYDRRSKGSRWRRERDVGVKKLGHVQFR